jgi:RNA polymerase sigma-70 factor (ECF subfamily)
MEAQSAARTEQAPAVTAVFQAIEAHVERTEAPFEIQRTLNQLTTWAKEQDKCSEGPQDDLQDLVALAVQGDRSAIESLLSELRPMVVRYCRARLGRVAGQHHLADDVAQEVCIAVLAALSRYRGMDRSFASFVFGIAAHKVTEALRSSVHSSMPTQDLPNGHDEGPGPEETVVRSIEVEHAQRLLARLSQRQRELLLRVVSGLPAEETGHILDMSPGAVRVAQSRALAWLQAMAEMMEESDAG